MEAAITGLVLAGAAAFIAGIVNALAGGGTLITFPVLVATGIPEVAANITNTVALCPGYFGGAIAQRRDLEGQGRRLRIFFPVAVLGGIGGGALLLFISAQVFHIVVPFLILAAALLLALQDRVRGWIESRAGIRKTGDDGSASAIVPLGLTAAYNGYFGAGGSVLIVAVLGLFLHDTMSRLNALKQCITLSANLAAAIFFLFSGSIVWPVALVMALCALAGGAAGGKLAGQVRPDTLRWTVVATGTIIGAVLLVRLWAG